MWLIVDAAMSSSSAALRKLLSLAMAAKALSSVSDGCTFMAIHHHPIRDYLPYLDQSKRLASICKQLQH
jgi:hypothetical protein